MASYPSATVSFATRLPNTTIASATDNAHQDEIVAIENGLRTGLEHDLKFTDALYDVGKSGATRPRDLFLSRNATVGGTLAVTGATTLTGAVSLVGAVTATAAITAPGLPVLLHAAADTEASPTAISVDSVTITGLTAFDTLVVEITMASVTQATAAPKLYSATDSVTIVSLTNSAAPIPAGGFLQMTVKIRQQQAGVTKLFAHAIGYDPSTGLVGGGNTWNNPTVTNWTGSWVLALRHGGVTAGGSLQYSWTVTKHSGQ